MISVLPEAVGLSMKSSTKFFVSRQTYVMAAVSVGVSFPPALSVNSVVIGAETFVPKKTFASGKLAKKVS